MLSLAVHSTPRMPRLLGLKELKLFRHELSMRVQAVDDVSKLCIKGVPGGSGYERWRAFGL
jgi:hypothetical protein